MARYTARSPDPRKTLEQFVRQATAKVMQSPDATARVKAHLDKRIAEMKAAGAPPLFEMFVDGSKTGDLSHVSFKHGEIEIKFPRTAGSALAILTHAKEISAYKSGRYRDAWFLIVNGRPWTDFTQPLPYRAEVYLTNFAPFARRREEYGRFGRSGRLSSYVRPENVVTERARQWGMKMFPGVTIDRTYISIPGGGKSGMWQVPYVLKRGPKAGETMLYPALRIQERT